ncbi:MAG: transcription elongation factor GreA [Chloroflexia bacterium]|jgi:transcription elongation factor GreA|nr:transcription elongation factor GreA [Chloroflexia bacterium]
MSTDRIPVTPDGHAKLLEELEHLVTVRRPEIIRAVATAREEGDLRENAGYDAARNDQGFIEGRIRDIESILKRIDIIDEDAVSADGSLVTIGATVTITIDGDDETYTIVGAVEANPNEGRISNESPFGKALLGKRVGDSVDIKTPVTTLNAKIVSVE